ncbi:restriction endonuclease subunit S [uncultured Herbaspirillum sp.]|uniref:restriction endonuclease subunit S n=1 Tax=uncultured Herbaspirillum sp. TaxID=160236 RepID=UPI002589277B|nr:restriction endonuclease subunit S [uncultured Herbaspirillum sp.]
MTSALEVRLGDVAEFIRGINFKPDDVVPLGTEGSVGCMRTKNVQEELDCSDVWAVSREFVRREEQLLAEGDILVSSANSWNLVGKCSWIPKLPWPSSFGGFVSVLRAAPDKVEPRFLYRWFSSERTQALLRSFGQKTTNISNLNIERCLNLTLWLPPLPEQRRIAAILDQADALRAKRREALAQLDELQQAIFIETFGDPATNPKGWPITTVGDLLKSASYGTSEKSATSGEFPVLRMNNITRTGEFDLSDLKYMDLADSEHERYLVKTGDVLFNRTNSAELVGKTAIFREKIPMAYAGYLIRLRTNESNDPEYLSGFMNTAYAKRILRGMCKSIIGMANINATEVQSIKLAKPPLKLQTQYRQRIGALLQVKACYRASLTELDSLFSSLQHRAFRGEL